MYLTDYQTTGYSFFQALVVPLEDEPFMITRAMEESNVHARTWVELTRPYPDTGDAIQSLVQSLREFGLDTKDVGTSATATTSRPTTRTTSTTPSRTAACSTASASWRRGGA